VIQHSYDGFFFVPRYDFTVPTLDRVVAAARENNPANQQVRAPSALRVRGPSSTYTRTSAPVGPPTMPAGGILRSRSVIPVRFVADTLFYTAAARDFLGCQLGSEF
jgi:hypothetical protein